MSEGPPPYDRGIAKGMRLVVMILKMMHVPDLTVSPIKRTWVELLENILWLASSIFIVYYGDRHFNLIHLLWHDDRIRRMPLYLGMVGIGLNVLICIYPSVIGWSGRRLDEKWEPTSMSSLPIVTLHGLISFCFLSVALWPIWSFLTLHLSVYARHDHITLLYDWIPVITNFVEIEFLLI